MARIRWGSPRTSSAIYGFSWKLAGIEQGYKPMQKRPGLLEQVKARIARLRARKDR